MAAGGARNLFHRHRVSRNTNLALDPIFYRKSSSRVVAWNPDPGSRSDVVLHSARSRRHSRGLVVVWSKAHSISRATRSARSMEWRVLPGAATTLLCRRILRCDHRSSCRVYVSSGGLVGSSYLGRVRAISRLPCTDSGLG